MDTNATLNGSSNRLANASNASAGEKRRSNPILRALPFAAIAMLTGLNPGGTAAQLMPTRTVSGIFTVIHRDPVDQGSRPGLRFYAVEERDGGRWTELMLSEDQVRDAGGLQALAAQRVTAVGTPLGSNGSHGAFSLRVDSLAIRPGAPPAGNPKPISGSVPVLNILCKFADVSSEPRGTAYFDELVSEEFPGLGHYWRENSADRINLRGSWSTGWLTLPQPRTVYVRPTGDAENPLDADLGRLYKDCRGAAVNAGFDPSWFTVLNLIFNGKLDSAAYGGVLSAGRERVTWIDARFDQSLFAHEMGHAFGLPHSAWPGNEGPWDVSWDVMDERHQSHLRDPIFALLGIHLNAYHKRRLGWISSDQVIDLPAGTTRTLTLERSAIPQTANPQMIRIPTSTGARYYTVEARHAVGYDDGDAVIIHEVDPMREKQPSWIMGEFGGTAWTPGETYISPPPDHVSVRVDAATATGFVVTVGSALQPLTVSVSGLGNVTGQGITCGTGMGGTGHGDDCDSAYEQGRVVSLKATPFVNEQAGQFWWFDHWEGSCTGTATACTVTMNGARTVRAVFTDE